MLLSRVTYYVGEHKWIELIYLSNRLPGYNIPRPVSMHAASQMQINYAKN